MTRSVTFWYTKQLPIFENNDDMAVTKIDVTRYQIFYNICSYKLESFIRENMLMTFVKWFNFLDLLQFKWSFQDSCWSWQSSMLEDQSRDLWTRGKSRLGIFEAFPSSRLQREIHHVRIHIELKMKKWPTLIRFQDIGKFVKPMIYCWEMRKCNK